MKKIIAAFLLAAIFSVGFFNFTEARGSVHVNGYYRKNGTYVQPHYRSAPDGNPYNNWSYPGNTNPYTGKTADGNSDTYLKNYYNNSSGSLGTNFNYNYSSPSYNNSYNYSLPGYSSNSGSGYDYQSNNSSIFSTDESCQRQFGNAKSYGLTQCKCGDGYVFNSDKTYCISMDQYCKNLYGYNAKVDSLNQCVCNDGYYFDKTNNTCVTLDQTCKSQYGLGAKSYGANQCICDTNFTWNKDRSSCISIYLACDSLTIFDTKTNSCISRAAYCIRELGSNALVKNNDFQAIGSAYENCSCSGGFVLNESKTLCVPEISNNNIQASQVLGIKTGSYNFTQDLKMGSKGTDVEILQNFLEVKQLLKIKKPTIYGIFGATTRDALKKYQKSQKLKQTGILDKVTRDKINSQAN